MVYTADDKIFRLKKMQINTWLRCSSKRWEVTKPLTTSTMLRAEEPWRQTWTNLMFPGTTYFDSLNWSRRKQLRTNKVLLIKTFNHLLKQFPPVFLMVLDGGSWVRIKIFSSISKANRLRNTHNCLGYLKSTKTELYIELKTF